MASQSESIVNEVGENTETGWTRKAMSEDEEVVRRGMLAYERSRDSLIQELKAAVWAGTYDPDTDEVAADVIAEREGERDALAVERDAVAKLECPTDD